LYHIIGCLTVGRLKYILRQNIIKNYPLTPEDVDIGGDIGTLEGKSTRRRPTPVKDDLVDIPPELLEQHQDMRLGSATIPVSFPNLLIDFR
jgi:hypothetical protein